MPEGFLKNRLEVHEAFEQPHFLDFFELSKKEHAALKKRVVDNKGLVRIFVHPYFDLTSDEANEARQNRINASVQKMVGLGAESSPPLFFMEEFYMVDELHQRLEKNLKQDIYIIPTEREDPAPRSTRLDSRLPDEQKWRLLSKMLGETGVKKVLLGGMIFRMLDEAGKKRFVGCVNGARNYLSSYFDVELSSMVAPATRVDYKNAKKDGLLLE
jgi:hypothetical protein